MISRLSAPLLATAPVSARSALEAPAPPAAPPPAAAQPAAQSDSVLVRANRRGCETVADWNDKIGSVAGGALGLGVIIPAVYGGIIGGVLVGGAAGLGFGPAAAVLQGAHGLSFLGSILSSGGMVAKAATVLGTATAAVGGVTVGLKVGEGLASIPIALVAYPIGFAQGLLSKDDPYQDPDPQPAPAPAHQERPSALTHTAAGLLGGAGLITGAVGGAVLGAGIGSGAALANGLMASNLTWSALGSGGMTGAAVGAVGLGIISGVGGYMIATGVARAISSLTSK